MFKRLALSSVFLSIVFLCSATQAAWYDTDWNYRVKITADSNKVSSAEVDIPLYVDLSEMPSSFFTNVKSDGSDIVVTASDETTVLNHELVEINTVMETGELHVKVDSLADTVDTDVYIYYGNASASDTSTPNVWSDYRAVWHLNEPAFTSSELGLGVATQQAMDGGDGAWTVFYGNNPISSTVKLAADEDQIGDSERGHTSEQVGYWIFGTGTAFDILDNTSTIIGEAGMISSLGTTPTLENLRNTYIDPIVITTPNLVSSSDSPAVVRISSTTANSFTAYMQNPGGLNSPAATDVYYIVIEAGAYTLPGGVVLEAGKTNIAGLNRKSSFGNSEMVELSPSNSFTNPVVLGQVMTNNDANWQVFWTSDGNAGNPPTAADIYVGRHIGEDTVTTRVAEDVGWVIIDESDGFTNSVEWSAAIGGDTVSGAGSSPPYSYTIFNSTLGGAFKDSTINGFNADALGNIAGEATGQIGNAVDFSGDANSRAPIGGLSYANNDDLDELTASFWLKTTDTQRSGILDFDRSEQWEVGLNFHNASGDAGKISFDTSASTGGIGDLNSSVTVNDDNWHHVVVVFDRNDPTDKKIYIDGSLSSSADQHSTGLGTGTTRYGFMADGSEANVFNGSTNNLIYEGLLDEVWIKHSVLSADRIATIYNNQSDNSSFWSFGVEEVLNTAPTEPDSLFVDHTTAQFGQVNPINLTVGGIANRVLNFSAVYNDGDIGDIANEARIQVSTDPTFGSITHWDSGFSSISNLSEGNRSADIEYDNFGAAATLPLTMNDGSITYYWRIAFKDDGGLEGEFSDPNMFTLLDDPQAPIGVSAVKIDGVPDTFDVTWLDASTTEDSFEVEVKEDAGSGFGAYTAVASSPTAADATSLVDNNTVINAAYMYRVRACNYSGCSAYTEDPSIHYTDPPAPIDVYSEYVSDSEFNLNFTDRSVVEIVDAERCDGVADCASSTYAVLQSGIATTKDVPQVYNDTNAGLVVNEIYRWRVRVNDGSATTSEYTLSPFEYTRPSAPTGVIATYMTDNLIQLTWSDNSNFEDGFRILVSEDGGPFTELTPGVNTVGSNITTYMFTDAQEDSSYDFVVRAHIGSTTYNSELFSADGASGTVLSTPGVPVSVTALYNADNDLQLDWVDNSTFEDGFDIYVSENGGGLNYYTTVPANTTTYNYTAGNSDSYYVFAVDSVVDADPPSNPGPLTNRSTLTTPPVYTTPTAPGLSVSSVSNSSIDWFIVDNSNIEQGFIFFEGDASTEVIRLNASDLAAYTETGLSPNTLYQRTIGAFRVNVPSIELVSNKPAVINVYTLANAPGNISVSENGVVTMVAWDDGGNPVGTEFFAENLTNGETFGWSTALATTFTAPGCNETHEILLKSRNQDLDETLSEIVEITGVANCPSGGGGSGGSSGSVVYASDDVDDFRPASDDFENYNDACEYASEYGIRRYLVPNPIEVETENGVRVFDRPGIEVVYPDFYDDQWGAQYMQVAVQHEIMDGFEDGLMRPNGFVTYGEFAKMLVNTVGVKVYSDDKVSEILSEMNLEDRSNLVGLEAHWSFNYLLTFESEFEVFLGRNLNEYMERGDVMKFIVEVYGLDDALYKGFFGDVNHFGYFAKSYVNPLIKADVLDGYPGIEGIRNALIEKQSTRMEALKMMLLLNNHCAY